MYLVDSCISIRCIVPRSYDILATRLHIKSPLAVIGVLALILLPLLLACDSEQPGSAQDTLTPTASATDPAATPEAEIATPEAETPAPGMETPTAVSATETPIPTAAPEAGTPTPTPHPSATPPTPAPPQPTPTPPGPTPIPAAQTTPETDRDALVALYNSTNGDGWTNKTNWLSAEPIDNWHGVSADDGRVTQINLPENNLIGTLPPELGNLASLRSLGLSGNPELTGEIPAAWGNLVNLYGIYLWGTGLNGEVPVEWGALENLSQARLPGMLCLPEELAGTAVHGAQKSDGYTNVLCPDLEALLALYKATDGDNWENNEDWLSGEPIGSWHGVSADNYPTGPKRTFRVNELLLANNNLTGELPPELGNLSSLRGISLDRNPELTGEIPAEWGNLSNLNGIYLRGTGLSGEVPVEWGALENLSYAWLGVPLCVPEELEGTEVHGKRGRYVNLLCPDMEALLALYEATNGGNWENNENWLSSETVGWYGVSFDSGGDFTKGTFRVNKLNLGRNNLIGELPAELGKLTGLEQLGLHENNLTGPLPPELGNLASLRSLGLSGNPELTGEIPAEWGNLSNLNGIYLRGTGLSGEVPVEWGALENLSLAHLGAPLCVPEELAGTAVHGGSSGNYRYANLLCPDMEALLALYKATDGDNWENSGDWLSSETINWYGVSVDWASYDPTWRVYQLSLPNNNLTGELPAELGKLTRLEQLNLHGNNLWGPLPPELGNMASLRSLNLAENNLAGDLDDIDNDLEKLANLRSLSLAENIWITGCVPEGLQAQLGSDSRPFGRWTSPMGRFCSGKAECSHDDHPGDRETLIDFYEATGGNQWAPWASKNWLSQGELCFWGGVTTNDEGRVTGLELGGGGLTGELRNSRLEKLESLETLDLSNNALSGPVPRSFESLTKLDSLDLSHNKLIGAITWGAGAQSGELFPNLRVLKLNHNDLTDVPARLDDLPQMYQLIVYSNKLKECVESQVRKCEAPKPRTRPARTRSSGSNLPPLSEEEKILEAVVRDREALVALYRNTREKTNWKAISERMGGCYFGWALGSPEHEDSGKPALEHWCGVTEVDEDGRVVKLDLGGIGKANVPGDAVHRDRRWGLGLNGTLPGELAGMDKLEYLDLSEGKICKGLRGCRENTGFTGQIPPGLGLLPSLQVLDLGGNNLTGSVYPLSCLPSLYFLDVSSNRLRRGATKFLGDPCYVPDSEENMRIRLSRNEWSEVTEPAVVKEAIEGNNPVITIQRGFVDLTESTVNQLGLPTDVVKAVRGYIEGEAVDVVAAGRYVNFSNKAARFVVRYAGTAAKAYTKAAPVVGWLDFAASTGFTLYDMTQATVKLLEGVKETRKIQSNKFLGVYTACEMEYNWHLYGRPDNADEILRNTCK